MEVDTTTGFDLDVLGNGAQGEKTDKSLFTTTRLDEVLRRLDTAGSYEATMSPLVANVASTMASLPSVATARGNTVNWSYSAPYVGGNSLHRRLLNTRSQFASRTSALLFQPACGVPVDVSAICAVPFVDGPEGAASPGKTRRVALQCSLRQLANGHGPLYAQRAMVEGMVRALEPVRLAQGSAPVLTTSGVEAVRQILAGQGGDAFPTPFRTCTASVPHDRLKATDEQAQAFHSEGIVAFDGAMTTWLTAMVESRPGAARAEIPLFAVVESAHGEPALAALTNGRSQLVVVPKETDFVVFPAPTGSAGAFGTSARALLSISGYQGVSRRDSVSGEQALYPTNYYVHLHGLVLVPLGATSADPMWCAAQRPDADGSVPMPVLIAPTLAKKFAFKNEFLADAVQSSLVACVPGDLLDKAPIHFVKGGLREIVLRDAI